MKLDHKRCSLIGGGLLIPPRIAAQDLLALQTQFCSEEKGIIITDDPAERGQAGRAWRPALCSRRLKSRVRLMIKFWRKRITDGT